MSLPFKPLVTNLPLGANDFDAVYLGDDCTDSYVNGKWRQRFQCDDTCGALRKDHYLGDILIAVSWPQKQEKQ